YPENSAGRRMQSEFIAVPPDWTVGQAIDYMRDTPDLPDRFYEIYAVDSQKHWQGAVSLDTLLRARRPVPIADLIDEDRRCASVLGLFEGQLEKMVALAVLAPIVASQGGNAATQTMTVAVRALATRELGSNNAFRVVMREAMVGLVNGLAFAVITGVAAVAWFKIPGLGVVIGLAIICNLIAGALGGILIPMLLERVKADPAVASGTFVTTVTDVVGFFAFLGIATLWFGLK